MYDPRRLGTLEEAVMAVTVVTKASNPAGGWGRSADVVMEHLVPASHVDEPHPIGVAFE